MKKSIFITFLFFSGFTYSQTWKSYKNHSRLSFTVTHLMVSSITGTIVMNSQSEITEAYKDFHAGKYGNISYK